MDGAGPRLMTSYYVTSVVRASLTFWRQIWPSVYNNKANATRLPDNESVNDARALYTTIVLGLLSFSFMALGTGRKRAVLATS